MENVGDFLPDDQKKIWEKWNVRLVMMLSLSLQTFLVLLPRYRPRSPRNFLFLVISSSYTLAALTPKFGIGLLSNTQDDSRDPSIAAAANSDLSVIWASFLLLHLAGPDTIIAVVIQDNELSLQTLLELIFEVVAVAIILFRSFSAKTLSIPALLLLVVGIIKYLGRLRAQDVASPNGFQDLMFMLNKPDPGPNYEKYVEAFGNAVTPSTITEPDKETKPIDNPVTNDNFNGLKEAHYAYYYFSIVKGLIAGLISSSYDRKESRQFFAGRNPQDALRLVEIELNFLYEIFYTKFHSGFCLTGYMIRFISFSLIVSSFSLFHLKETKHSHNKIDIRITNALFLAAIGLEIVTLIMLNLSYRSLAAVGNPAYESESGRISASRCWYLIHKRFSSWIFRLKGPRWHRCIQVLSVVRYSLEPNPIGVNKVTLLSLYGLNKYFNWFGLPGLVEMCTHKYIAEISDDLWVLIFNELKKKSQFADNGEEVKRMFSAIEDTALGIDCTRLMPYITDVSYSESLLLWHIATELLYHTEDRFTERNHYKESSKLLSDYMLYLLIMQPTMMIDEARSGKTRLRDTCAEAMRFFENKCLGPNERERACKLILSVNTDIKPSAVKGDRSKSVLFDACILAKELCRLGEDRNEGNKEDIWKMISKVWVELLLYAAIHCDPWAHVNQVARGGQLLTIVWLLAIHLGLEDKFQSNPGNV